MTTQSTTPPGPRIALVTGAGSGIGKGCATALLHDGWHVVFAGRRIDALQAAIAAAGDAETASRGTAIACDVTREESVAALFDAIRQRFGRLDLLFNNAGISLPAKSPDEVGAAAWRNAVDTNLNGAFFCLAEAFKLMRSQSPQGGRIVNNGSISAHAPRPGSIAYTATKHAISGLTRAAALDGRPFDIAVGQIDIGNAATEMAVPMQQGVRQANGSIAVEATMDVQHVADAIVQLAQLPLSVNVPFMTLMANRMPYIGRG